MTGRAKVSFACASKSTWAGHLRLVKYASFGFLSDFLGKKIFKILHSLCACSKVKFLFSCSLAGGSPEFKCFSNREKYYLDFGGLPVTVEWENKLQLSTYLHFCANTINICYIECRQKYFLQIKLLFITAVSLTECRCKYWYWYI